MQKLINGYVLYDETEVDKNDAFAFDFLASPYYSENEAIRNQRYAQTKAALAALIQEGRRVFSPIVMCHPVAVHSDLGLTAADWETFNRPFIRHASNVIVLRIGGWDESRGVAREIELGRKYKKSIEYLDPDI